MPSVSSLEEAAERARAPPPPRAARCGSATISTPRAWTASSSTRRATSPARSRPGIRLSALAAALAPPGQRLSLDPPGDPTIGACLAANLSGPLRHRFGAPRDLVLGVTLVLADGTIANAGGKVVKNVAGYDLGKLVCGSRGRLALDRRASACGSTPFPPPPRPWSSRPTTQPPRSPRAARLAARARARSTSSTPAVWRSSSRAARPRSRRRSTPTRALVGGERGRRRRLGRVARAPGRRPAAGVVRTRRRSARPGRARRSGRPPGRRHRLRPRRRAATRRRPPCARCRSGCAQRFDPAGVLA